MMRPRAGPSVTAETVPVTAMKAACAVPARSLIRTGRTRLLVRTLACASLAAAVNGAVPPGGFALTGDGRTYAVTPGFSDLARSATVAFGARLLQPDITLGHYLVQSIAKTADVQQSACAALTSFGPDASVYGAFPAAPEDTLFEIYTFADGFSVSGCADGERGRWLGARAHTLTARYSTRRLAASCTSLVHAPRPLGTGERDGLRGRRYSCAI